MQNKPITIDYFSDILCVWAWVAQRRIEELNKNFEERINIRYQYLDIFGDTATRIQSQWADKGMYDGFRDHILESAAPYDTAPVNPDVWSKIRPTTSANAHMLLKAVELNYGQQKTNEFSVALRKAFFINAIDISNLETLYTLLMQNQYEIDPITNSINKGTAIAALMQDYQKARQYDIKGSPCFIMNNGRQTLFGNVGYRVLHTNVEEILNSSADEASWC